MIGHRLTLLRNTLNLSRHDVASKSGVSYHAYRNYELNKCPPSYDNLILLADFFAVSIDYLTGRSNDINTKDYGEMYANLRENAYEKYLLAHKIHDKEDKHIHAEWPYNLLERIYRDTKYPFETILSDDQKKGLEWALNTLTDRQLKVLEGRFKYEKTLDEIGKEMGVSGERIRSIEFKAIGTLRNLSRRTSIEKGYEAARLEKELNNIEKLKIQIELELEEIEKLKKLKEEYNIGPNGHSSLSIDDIGLTTRAYTCLRRAGCNTIEQVIEKFKDRSIYKIRNLGQVTIKDIISKVAKRTGIILPE